MSLSVTTKARQRAQSQHVPYAVVEMDDGDYRQTYAVPLSYCDEPEFEAFDGKIVLIVHPDGTTE